MQPLTDTRHLALLVAIEDHGSLVAAAKRLHLTPSALSQQLRELEERIGGPLFRREWRQLTPTRAGRRFIDGARTVLGELGRVEDETRRLLDGHEATLRVATMCQQSYRWLTRVLELFAADHPDVDVSIVPEAAESPDEWLLERRLDAILVAGALSAHAHVRVAPLFRDEMVAVVGRRHPWAGKRSVPAAAFAREHLLTDAMALRTSEPLGAALAAAGNVVPRRVTYVPMTGSIPVDMARANLGITLLPRWVVDAYADPDLRAVRIGARGLWLRWSVATRAEEPEPALTAFLAALRAGHPNAARRTGPRA